MALFAIVSLLLLVLAKPAATRLKEELESGAADACEPCKLRVEELSFGVSPPRVILSGIKFESGDPRDSAVSFEAEQIVVPVPPRNLGGSGPWHLGLVRISGIQVLVHEGDLTLPKKKKEEGGEPLQLEVEGVEVTAASFTYRKDSPAGAAKIHLPELSAEISEFGTYGEWLEKKIEGKAEASLESSGKVALITSTLIGVEGPWVDVDLRIRGQNLKELNAYFRPEEGVTMSGKLLDSRAVVNVRNEQAIGNVEVRYEGLAIMFHPNRHRGGLSAILTNLGALIKVNKGNSGEPRRDRGGAVVVRRHAKESVVSFILRAMREVALRVAT